MSTQLRSEKLCWRYEQLYLKPGVIDEMRRLLPAGRWSDLELRTQLDASPYTVEINSLGADGAELLVLSTMLQSVLATGTEFGLLIVEQEHKGEAIELNSALIGELKNYVLNEVSRLFGTPEVAQQLAMPGARVQLQISSPYISKGQEQQFQIPAMLAYQNLVHQGRIEQGLGLN